MKDTLLHLFDRDLNRLKKEVKSYSKESNLWLVNAGIMNSGGNLTLHLLGNLNYHIGHVIGRNGYFRDRDAEFNQKNVPRSDLLESIEDTMLMVSKTILSMPEDYYERLYPENVDGEILSYEYFLFHLVAHFNYHLGQINYHRRLLDKT